MDNFAHVRENLSGNAILPRLPIGQNVGTDNGKLCSLMGMPFNAVLSDIYVHKNITTDRQLRVKTTHQLSCGQKGCYSVIALTVNQDGSARVLFVISC